jgi:hypothetical protein
MRVVTKLLVLTNVIIFDPTPVKTRNILNKSGSYKLPKQNAAKLSIIDFIRLRPEINRPSALSAIVY